MRLVTWWLTLMSCLPLLYLFWWKKTWRLFLGIIVFALLIAGWILPSKLAFSVLKKELKKVEEKMRNEGWAKNRGEWEKGEWKKLEKALENTFQQEITPQNQEKIALEKEIIKWKKEYKKASEEEQKKESPNEKYLRMAVSVKKYEEKSWEWARKWGGKEDPPVFLFCGEEFNYELTKRRTTFKRSWKIVEDWSWHSDVIDFGKYGNAKPDFVRKRIREIWDYWNSGITRGSVLVDCYPIILLKNIDRIINPELKKEFLLITDPQKNDKYDKYQIKDWNRNSTNEEGNIDLSKFVLVTTTSTSNPQLPKELRNKLNHIEPFLDKYYWSLFFFSLGIEIIVFLLIKKKFVKR